MTVTELTSAQARQREAARTYELQYAAFRRKRATLTLLFWSAFAVCLIISGVTAKFDVLTVLQGLPRTTEFLVKMVPPIHLSTFGEDVAEWYWGIGKWLNSLLNTLLM